MGPFSPGFPWTTTLVDLSNTVSEWTKKQIEIQINIQILTKNCILSCIGSSLNDGFSGCGGGLHMLWKTNWHPLPSDSGTQEQNYTVLAIAVGAAVLLLLIVAVILVTYKTRRKAVGGKRMWFVFQTCCDAQYVRDQPHVLLDTCWASMWAVVAPTNQPYSL